MSALVPGQVLFGKYEVERVLGQGGMGQVVAALHADLKRRVAIKCLLSQYARDPEIVARFMREAQAAATLESRHVGRIFDVGRLDDGDPVIVMEFLQGRDLGQELAARGPLPIGEVITYLAQACEAIAEAHALGIVHRDIKPANLFLTTSRDGLPCIKVLDFGISKVRDADAPDALTKTSGMMGTAYYMPPEQMSSAKKVDHRADIWALGVTAFELLTGEHPFEAPDLPKLAVKIFNEPPSSLKARRPAVPPELEAAIATCLQKDPERRFATVADLAHALQPDAAASAGDTGATLPSFERDLDRSNAALPLHGPLVGQAALPSLQAARTTSPASSDVIPTTTGRDLRPLWAWAAAGSVIVIAAGAGAWLGRPGTSIQSAGAAPAGTVAPRDEVAQPAHEDPPSVAPQPASSEGTALDTHRVATPPPPTSRGPAPSRDGKKLAPATSSPSPPAPRAALVSSAVSLPLPAPASSPAPAQTSDGDPFNRRKW